MKGHKGVDSAISVDKQRLHGGLSPVLNPTNVRKPSAAAHSTPKLLLSHPTHLGRARSRAGAPLLQPDGPRHPSPVKTKNLTRVFFLRNWPTHVLLISHADRTNMAVTFHSNLSSHHVFPVKYRIFNDTSRHHNFQHPVCLL